MFTTAQHVTYLRIEACLRDRFAPVLCPSSAGRAVASLGCSLHNTLTLLSYLMTHTGAGPHALTPSHSCIRARAHEILVCVCFPSDRFKTDQLPINVKITGSTEADGGSEGGGGGLFVSLPSLMTCQTNQPPLTPPPPCILTLPRARIHPQRPRAHNPTPPLPLDTHLRAHKHTRSHARTRRPRPSHSDS